jgi:hypothetical protein
MTPDTQDQSSKTQAAPAGKAAASGGRFTNRGIVIQTLVALLEVVNQDPPFETVTLEPLEGDDQFDFVWSRGEEKHATQVKSSKNSFMTGKIEEWAQKMADARKAEKCKLMLVGPMDTKVSDLKHKGHAGVSIHTLHVDDPDDLPGLEQLRRLGSDLLADFLPTQGLSPDTAQRRRDMIDKLNGELILKAASGTPSTHQDFCKTLGRWFPPLEPEAIENAYPRVVEKLSDILQQNSALKEFIQQAAPSLFETKTLAKTLGCQRLDIKPVLDAILEKLPSRQPDKTFAEALDLSFGCLLVLAVDPAWAARQREECKTRELPYPGSTFDKAFGSQSINYLNLVLRAIADKECGFEELFVLSSESEENKIPGLPELMKGIRPDDVQTEVKYTITEFMFAMVQRIQKAKPSLHDIDKLFDELREQMADAYLYDRPFHATDASFEPYVDMLKKDLRLGSLLLVFPRGGSETEIVDKAHLLITRLHALRGQLQRLRRSSPN